MCVRLRRFLSQTSHDIRTICMYSLTSDYIINNRQSPARVYNKYTRPVLSLIQRTVRQQIGIRKLHIFFVFYLLYTFLHVYTSKCEENTMLNVMKIKNARTQNVTALLCCFCFSRTRVSKTWLQNASESDFGKAERVISKFII